MRKPFEGVFNIIRFNWHFYAIALIVLAVLLCCLRYFSNGNRFYLLVTFFIVIGAIIFPLLVSFYVYDLSGLYQLPWIEREEGEKRIINIHSGFDETSVMLREKYKNSELIVLDFYDPRKHTEPSISRARKAYPAFRGTRRVETSDLQIPDNSADNIFVIFSAHEIRNELERINFFNELKRVMKAEGNIYMTEHLRDAANFLAYNIGFFHFYSKRVWLKTFKEAGLHVKKEVKHTPFISTFILSKNGNTF